MFKNMKIGTRLALSFAVVIAITVVLSVLGIISFTQMSDKVKTNHEQSSRPLSYLVDFSIAYGNVRSAMRDLYVYSSAESNEKQKTAIESNFVLMEAAISSYLKMLEGQGSAANPDEHAAVKKVSEAVALYKDALFNRLVPAGMDNRNEDADNVRATELVGPGNIIRDQIKFLTDNNITVSENILAENETTKTQVYTIQIGMMLAGLLVSIGLAVALILSITKPVHALVRIAKSVSQGDLTVNRFKPGKDEIGTLVQSFFIVMDTFESLVNDLNAMATAHHAGDVDVFAVEDKYSGKYRVLVESTNLMVREHIQEKKLVLCKF